MSVTLPGTAAPLTTEDIRMFLRDTPDYNPLLDDVEFSDPDIVRGIRFAVAKYNAIAPGSRIVAGNMNEWLLLCGVCCVLFRSEGARQLRNQVLAQDGNIAPVGIDEKQALYAAWADRMCAEFDQLAAKLKQQANMEGNLNGPMGAGGSLDSGAYGGVSSGYRYIGRWSRY